MMNLFFYGGLILALLVAFVVTMPIRNSQTRSHAIADTQYRWQVIIGLSVLAFLIVYVVSAGIYAEFQANSVYEFFGIYDPYIPVTKAQISRELWVETLLGSSGCFHAEIQVCEGFAVATTAGIIDSDAWLIIMLTGLLSAFLTGVYVWLMTRSAANSSKDKSDK